MRLLVTADLHFDHAKSRILAERLIAEMNGIDAEALLLVGDTATSRGSALEECLSLFQFPGPRLFVPGNHELWSADADTYRLYHEDLPRRVRAAGWHWLDAEPRRIGDVAFVGSVGWYDYAFASQRLAIPRIFYEHKTSPGAVAYLRKPEALLPELEALPESVKEIVARWNDGRYVRLGRGDSEFLDELLDRLAAHLHACADARHVVAAIHHVPLAQLLPPTGRPQLEFARAYLGSPKLGQIIQNHPNVRTLLCGHSHFPAEASVGRLHAINIGSGYRQKHYRVLTIAP